MVHTITTAAQHDEKMTRANTMLEAADQRYEEAMKRIAELESSGGMRRRTAGKGAGGVGESKDGGGGGAAADGGDGGDDVRVVRTGFPLWQVVLLAVIMFVVGTFMHGSSPES